MAQKTEAVNIVEYTLTLIFSWLVRIVPYRLAFWLGSFLGLLVYFLWPGRRRLAQKNLAEVFKDKQPAELTTLAKEVFRNVGRTLIEFIYYQNWDKEQLLTRIEVEGREYLEAALAKGKGVILLGAHFGNWEMLGLAVSAMGYKINVVARALDNPRLDRLVTQIRCKFGMAIIANTNSIKDVIKCLRKNESVGILIDQNLYENAVFVEYFGKLAATTPIVPLLAQKTEAAIIPIRMIRLAHGKHRLIIENELVMREAADRQEFVRINTTLCNQVIEKWVRQNPEQWFWVHNRWKTRPAETVDKSDTLIR